MDEKQTIAILGNPFGNKKKISKILDEIKTILQEKGIPFLIFQQNWPPGINIYKEAWIIGGDGTINYFLNHYKDITIPLVLFKGGTGNDFATMLYGKMSVSEQTVHVINANAQHVDAAECNGRKFINGVGIGFDGEVLKSMNAIRFLGGHLGYLWIVLRKIFSFKERDYQIQYDENRLSGKFLLVMITNSTSTGGGFIVSPESVTDDGKLNMVLCKPLPILKRLKYLPVIEKGKHLNRHFIIHQEVNNVKIIGENKTLAQIDGELISAETFDIKVLPGYYLFKY